MAFRRVLHGRAVTGVVVAAIVWLVGSAAPVDAANFNPPKHYYLALGDSLAFGAQLGKFFGELGAGAYDPATFNTGYVDDFAARLRSMDPGMQTVNLSCPAETSASFSGTCFFRSLGFPIKVNYSGSQEAAALAFLRAHPGEVSPITIDLGLNDAQLPCSSPTFSIDVECFKATVPAALQSIAANLPRILDELHGASPSSEIIVMKYYNPFFVVDPSTDAFVVTMNNEIAAMAAARSVRVADIFTAFNRTGDERSTLCALTLVCNPPLFDEHASDAGYAVMANGFWNASGYSQLSV